MWECGTERGPERVVGQWSQLKQSKMNPKRFPIHRNECINFVDFQQGKGNEGKANNLFSC